MGMSDSTAHNPADPTSVTPQGYLVPTKQIRLSDLKARKGSGTPFAMLTAYDYSTARAFAQAGIEVMLVGDSAANVVFGYPTTAFISMDELCFLAAAVVRGAGNAFVMVDMPFGSYEASNEKAVLSAVELLHRSGGHCVKLEGGVRMAPRIKAIKDAGIAVCAHIGFTPQSVNNLGGFKVQGRGSGADALLEDMRAVVEAGADFVLMEMVPAEVAKRVTEECPVPTIGIGAGRDVDGQVLVWNDIVAFPSDGHRPKFAKQWGAVGDEMTRAAAEYKREVAEGTFPAPEHEFAN